MPRRKKPKKYGPNRGVQIFPEVTGAAAGGGGGDGRGGDDGNGDQGDGGGQPGRGQPDGDSDGEPDGGQHAIAQAAAQRTGADEHPKGSTPATSVCQPEGELHKTEPINRKAQPGTAGLSRSPAKAPRRQKGEAREERHHTDLGPTVVGILVAVILALLVKIQMRPDLCENENEFFHQTTMVLSSWPKFECKSLTQCDAGEWESQAPTMLRDRVCQPTTTCTPTQFERAPPQCSRSDRQCANLTVCADHQFDSVAPSKTGDRECRDLQTCSPLQFETKAATKTSDRQCKSYLQQCPLSDNFFVTARTPTTDRVCRQCLRCASDQFACQSCTATIDRRCCAVVNCTPTQFESVAPTESTNRECTNLAVCSDQQFESVAPASYTVGANDDTKASTLTSDRVCKDCMACTPHEQYETKAATTTADRECADVSACPGYQFEAVASTHISDRVCTTPKLVVDWGDQRIQTALLTGPTGSSLPKPLRLTGHDAVIASVGNSYEIAFQGKMAPLPGDVSFKWLQELFADHDTLEKILRRYATDSERVTVNLEGVQPLVQFPSEEPPGWTPAQLGTLWFRQICHDYSEQHRASVDEIRVLWPTYWVRPVAVHEHALAMAFRMASMVGGGSGWGGWEPRTSEFCFVDGDAAAAANTARFGGDVPSGVRRSIIAVNVYRAAWTASSFECVSTVEQCMDFGNWDMTPRTVWPLQGAAELHMAVSRQLQNKLTGHFPQSDANASVQCERELPQLVARIAPVLREKEQILHNSHGSAQTRTADQMFMMVNKCGEHDNLSLKVSLADIEAWTSHLVVNMTQEVRRLMGNRDSGVTVVVSQSSPFPTVLAQLRASLGDTTATVVAAGPRDLLDGAGRISTSSKSAHCVAARDVEVPPHLKEWTADARKHLELDKMVEDLEDVCASVEPFDTWMVEIFSTDRVREFIREQSSEWIPRVEDCRIYKTLYTEKLVSHMGCRGEQRGPAMKCVGDRLDENSQWQPSDVECSCQMNASVPTTQTSAALKDGRHVAAQGSADEVLPAAPATTSHALPVHDGGGQDATQGSEDQVRESSTKDSKHEV